LALRVHHLHGILRACHAGLLGRGDPGDDGTRALPRHRRRKPDHRLKRGEPGASPVGLPEAPATLQRLGLTLGGRRGSPTSCHAGMGGTIHQAPHALGPSTLVLRALLQVENPGRNGGKPIVDSLPPPQATIAPTVTGSFGGAPRPPQVSQRRQGETHGRHGGLWVQGVLGSHRRDAALATPRTRPDVDGRLGLPGHASRPVRGRRRPLDRSSRGEEGGGGREGWCGGRFATCYGESPRACHWGPRVAAGGRVAAREPWGVSHGRRTSAAVRRGDRRGERHGGAAWLWLSPRVRRAGRRGGRGSAARLRPRRRKAALQRPPRARSRGP